MSDTRDLAARDALRRQLVEHEQRLREVIGQAFGRDIADQSAPSALATPVPSVTPRDLEILRLLILGQTNRQIGLRVRLRPGTVRNHLSRIFRKLGVNTRTEAAVRVVELGLIRVNDGHS
jgi:DNA-binding NarL/FixJ family response regulator